MNKKIFSILLVSASVIIYIILFYNENKKTADLPEFLSEINIVPAPQKVDYKGYLLGVPRNFMQKYDNTCAASALRFYLNMKKIRVSEEELAEKLEITSEGTSFASIVKVAKEYGINFTGLRTDIDTIRNRTAIIQLKFGHFAVYLQSGKYHRDAYIFDPAYGYVFIFERDLKKVWKGYALVEDF